MCWWYKKKKKNNRLKAREKNEVVPGCQMPRPLNGEKTIFSTNTTGETGYPHTKVRL